MRNKLYYILLVLYLILMGQIPIKLFIINLLILLRANGHDVRETK